jgi:hypothetical protein
MVGGTLGRSIVTIVACGVALIGSGCGDSDEPADAGSSALGSPDLVTTAREADCTDWDGASVEERRVIVKSIAEFEGGAPTGTQGRTLPEDEAYDLFERLCEQEYASAFKLYKVYVRAAAFQSARP